VQLVESFVWAYEKNRLAPQNPAGLCSERIKVNGRANQRALIRGDTRRVRVGASESEIRAGAPIFLILRNGQRYMESFV